MGGLVVLYGLFGEGAEVASGVHAEEGLELRDLAIRLCIGLSCVEITREGDTGSRCCACGRLTGESGLYTRYGGGVRSERLEE